MIIRHNLPSSKPGIGRWYLMKASVEKRNVEFYLSPFFSLNCRTIVFQQLRYLQWAVGSLQPDFPASAVRTESLGTFHPVQSKDHHSGQWKNRAPNQGTGPSLWRINQVMPQQSGHHTHLAGLAKWEAQIINAPLYCVWLSRCESLHVQQVAE